MQHVSGAQRWQEAAMQLPVQGRRLPQRHHHAPASIHLTPWTMLHGSYHLLLRTLITTNYLVISIRERHILIRGFRAHWPSSWASAQWQQLVGAWVDTGQASSRCRHRRSAPSPPSWSPAASVTAGSTSCFASARPPSPTTCSPIPSPARPPETSWTSSPLWHVSASPASARSPKQTVQWWCWQGKEQKKMMSSHCCHRLRRSCPT